MYITQIYDKQDNQLLGSCNSYIDRDVKTIKAVHKRLFDYRILHISDHANKVRIFKLNPDNVYNMAKWQLVDNFLISKKNLI